MTDRHMLLGAYMMVPNSHYSEVWRHPYSEPDVVSQGVYRRLGIQLESYGFDFAFIPDTLSIPPGDDGTTSRAIEAGDHGVIRHDPTILAQTIASATRRLGVGVTVSTTFWEPYHIARIFSSLAHLTNGRIAWNIITSVLEKDAANFGRALPNKDRRYDHADGVVSTAMALWSSWAPDALVLDKEKGVYANPSRVRGVSQISSDVVSPGPLTLPYAPGGGRPVFFQAGESDRGRAFAARWGEIIFAMRSNLESLRELRTDVISRAVTLGRDPNSIRQVAAVVVVVGESDAIAKAREDYLIDLIDPARAARRVTSRLGIALPENLDVTVEQLVESDLSRLPGDILEATYELGRNHATLRDVGIRLARSKSTPWIVGSPVTVADRLQELFDAEAVDGFIFTPTHFPGTFDDLGRAVIPELRRRGLLKALNEGAFDFRSRLGLPPARSQTQTDSKLHFDTV